MGNVCKSLVLCGSNIPDYVETDDEDFYRSTSKPTGSRAFSIKSKRTSLIRRRESRSSGSSIEKSLARQTSSSSNNQAAAPTTSSKSSCSVANIRVCKSSSRRSTIEIFAITATTDTTSFSTTDQATCSVTNPSLSPVQRKPNHNEEEPVKHGQILQTLDIDMNDDSALNWSSSDTILDNLDQFSLNTDSGFNSSSSLIMGASFDFDPSHAQIEPLYPIDSQHTLESTTPAVVIQTCLAFDALLSECVRSGWKHEFYLGCDLDQYNSMPYGLLKHAFSSWSKGSLLRLSHTVMNRFLVNRTFFRLSVTNSSQNPALISNVQKSSVAAAITTKCGSSTGLRLNDLTTMITLNSLLEYKSNLIYKFYSHYSLNF